MSSVLPVQKGNKKDIQSVRKGLSADKSFEHS